MLAALALLVLAPQDSGPARDPVVAPPLERIHVVGASISAGFGTRSEFGVPFRVTYALQAMLPESTEVSYSADEWMFARPVEAGDGQVEEAIDSGATTLFGLDFLFWYAAGVQDDEDARLERLQEGLDALEQFEGLIVVGNIPNVRYALDGNMISEAQLPADESLVKLNARITEWAAKRGRVHVIPVAKFAAEVPGAESLEIRGHVYEQPFESLLQRDLLHTNVDGSIAVVRMALDSLPGIELIEGIEWDPAKLRARCFERWAPAAKQPKTPVPTGGSERAEQTERAVAPPVRRSA